MKYYPLSQLTTNLYTKGNEYVIAQTGKNYKGYYYKTSNQEFYSGKTPSDKPNLQLKPLVSPETNDFSPLSYIKNKKSFWVIGNPSYKFGQGNSPSLPTSIYPKITKEEYKLGEFQRYFLSKTNEIKFIEVNKFNYNQYKNNNPEVAYQLYLPINISWTLTGNREDVYKINYNTVTLAQKRLNLVGFIQYFQNRFTQFYKESGE